MTSRPDQRVRLLGPVDIHLGDTQQPVAGLRRKAVLAALALSAGHSVSVDKLIDVVWSGDAPATAANTLQSHISHLRGLFRTRDAIIATPAGYRLELAGDATDLRTAERLLAQAKQTSDVQQRAETIRRALALWRSRPMADLSGIEWFDEQAERIERLRADAFTSLIDARLTLGEHGALIPELEDLVRQHPLDEALHAQLILALYQSGRQADAFAIYGRLRARLLDELGLDPGRRLRDLETAMLRQDPSLEPPPAPVGAATAARATSVVPAQLPPALAQFIGREAELDTLDEALQPGPGEPAMTIVAISGPPGVGKTSLAVGWAHRIVARFPDGQLYVNLRGYSPEATLDPADALHGFLEALGVAPQRIPEALTARMGLYRSVLAGKRVLVLLDNGYDAEQVRPLLPGAPGCVALITSRNKLTPLVAAEGALAVPVDVLSRDAAHGLLAQRLGQKRIVNEPDAVDDIVSRCAGLPLALGIVAARAATEPGISLATIAGQMRVATDALDTLAGGDHSADVRAVISWSYAVLSPRAARVFRDLALHPGAEIGANAVASLTGVPLAQVRAPLTELVGANLLSALDGVRYAFHDLIRAYAGEQAQLSGTDAERYDAVHRLADHYLHTADAAAGLLDAYRDTITLGEPLAGVTAAPLANHEQALEWLTIEYPALLQVIEQAAASGLDAHAWRLACVLTEFFERRGLWRDWLAALDVALRSAERLADQHALAHGHRGLGRAHHWLGNYGEADFHHRQALDHFTDLGDRLGQARVWHSLGRLAELQGQFEDALTYTSNGLELFRAAGDPPGVAKALNGLGWYHCLLGDFHQALRYCGEALRLLQELGDRRVEANTWDSLGFAHHRAGDLARAVDCYQQALALFRDMGDRYHEADASIHLGDTYAEMGDEASARRTWRLAQAILDELGHPDAASVRAKLAAVEDR